MAIYRLTEGGVYGPELVKIMASAYECALGTLNLKDRNDPACELVATTIIKIVEGGTRDAHEVYEQTVAAFKTRES